MDRTGKRKMLKKLIDQAKNYRSGRVLTTAVDDEILSRFNNRPRTIEEVTREKEAPEAVGRIVKTLAAMGFLDRKDDDRFVPTDLTRTFLLPESSLDLRPILKLFHRNYDLWQKLPKTLRQGQEIKSDVFGDVEFGREFMLAMEARAQFAKSDVADAIDPILSENDHILDLGGGTGIFLREILKQYPTTEAVLADLGHVVETAREFSTDSGLADRLEFRELDFFEYESYGQDFDVVLLFSICHMFGRERNETLLKRTAKTLQPDGKLIIRDYLLEDGGVGPIESNLFDLHMLLATDTGRNYTLAEYQELFWEAGLQYDRQLTVPGQDELIVAKKA